MIVSAVPPEQVVKIWPQVSGYLDRATRTVRVRADITDIYEQILEGKQTLWIAFSEDDGSIYGAVTTQVIDYPQYKSLAIPFVGGESMKDWIEPMLSTLEDWAKDCGCETFEGYGREAWGRHLQKRGWKKAYVCWEKDLTNGT